ncbi:MULTISPECIES: C-terminal helicase domain-containing protein [unclassified Roseofilum]|uniref:C-terminal helicase domain-containing protein n=2 Tax=unclassified Roseofilum TaxID=2620099 RepID=UPI00298E3616|nr:MULTISPECIES: helicase-related protein [unclassified Roseofilum]
MEDIDPAGYDIGKLTEAIEADIQKLNEILERLQKIHQSVEAGKDSDRKLIAFKDLLLTLKNQKILVFSYFKDTATYIHAQLKNDKDWCEAVGFPTIDLITGNTPGKQREIKVKRFAPKANTESEEERKAIAQHPIDILICTDVLSEGQNLQDAGILVNYDLHWNPVRMIQRAGRIDRLGTDYETLYIYNCFPEEGLESLLHLVERLQKRIADIDNNVGLDASVLGEEISNRSLEELQRLKQADSEAEKQAILEELEQVSDLVSLDEMRLPLLEFMQRIGQEVVSEIPMGIHSTKYLTINDPQYREGGVFLAFKASDRHFWYFYPRQDGQICLDTNLLITDLRKLFNWLKCQESDFPPPDTLAPVSFDRSIFDVVQGATENLLQYFQRHSTSSKLKPKLTGILQKIYQVLIQTTLGTEWTSDEQETKDRVLQVLENRELQSYKRETKQLWEDYRNHQNEKDLLYKLDELLIENELYQDLDAPNLESIRKVIKAEDIQLVCYEWFYQETS